MGFYKVSKQQQSIISKGSIFILTFLLVLNLGSSSLIDDPVAQRTSILPYPTSLMFKDAYFDISFKEGGALVQVDNNATYSLTRTSVLSYNYFQFTKVFHSNQSVAQIYQNIDFTGYQVYGMCLSGGSLDYVIALDRGSGEVRILRLTYNIGIELGTVQDYKTVDKDSNLTLQGNILVDCKQTEVFLGVNTYTIGIAGAYMHPNLITSYYLAKFSTKFNLTEYFVKSEDPYTMENPKLVRVDPNNQMIYLALEINKNYYHGSTVYQPGINPGVDNANVAIVSYSWTFGVRMWITVIGDAIYSDSFGDMEYQDYFLYVAVNSYSTLYSTNSSQRDINYYKLRTENGYIQANTTFGSPLDDLVYDIDVSFGGIYMLALINGPFLPHRQVNKQWAVQNNNPNLAIILIDFTDQILDIEAYDIATVTSPYPVNFFLARYQGVRQTMIFINHRSNNLSDLKGGLYITYLAGPTLIYSLISTTCDPSCARCSPEVTTKCIECNSGYVLFQHTCYSQSCPTFSYSVTDSSLAPLAYCKSCHYSCKQCTGPQRYQCTSCCQNGACGATFDRVPTLGQCLCQVGTTESNGACNFKCILNEHGRRGNICYPQCPADSYPLYQYDQALQAQERTQFDSSSPTDCVKYSNMLQFNKNGKGIQVEGPNDFEQMPQQFTLAFWVMPTNLNSLSTFINAFGRIKVIASLATLQVQFKFLTGASTFVQPDYSSTATDYQIVLNTWNYISVSQREVSVGTTLLYQQQFGMTQGNFGAVKNAGYRNLDPVVNYPYFVNTLFLGADSDINPMGFSGYLKEIKLFTIYHGYAQMQDEMLRLYRYYSYDDQNLVAYWKLSESYSSANLEYTIYDYSATQNSFEFSTLDDPDYPFFTVDNSNQITFCLFHDVATCLSVDYSQTVPIVTNSIRLMTPPTFILNDLTQVKSDTDQVWYVPSSMNCTESEVLAKMNYSSAAGAWTVPDITYTPMNLLEGTHYQLCYYNALLAIPYNLCQIYVASPPRTIDPSNSAIYNRTDNVLQWMTGAGDQAYGDVFRFMESCSQPYITDLEIQRSNVPDYPIVNIMEQFQVVGNFYFCWYPVFTQALMPVPFFEPVHYLKFQIQYEPTLNPSFQTTGQMNENMLILDIQGTFQDGDQFRMAWKGTVYSDCNPINYIGNPYTYNHSHWPGIWLGYESGIFGVKQLSNDYMDELQACWQPAADQAPKVFIRIKKADLNAYYLRLFGYTDPVAQQCPELLSFNPEYGASTLYETDKIIQFNFKTQAVVPAKPPTGLSRTLGQLIICRGGVAPDGTIIKVATDILWQNLAMDESYLPDPFQQGGVFCTQTGQCQIILDATTSRMLSGEIYFLQFFTYSFATINNGVKYYLFNDMPVTLSQSAYDHIFFCRSFDIQPMFDLINGDSFSMAGTDLLFKQSRSKFSQGQILTDTFYTQAIYIKLTVFDTSSPYCIDIRPTATVAYEDIYDDHFNVNNLLLRQCNEGNLFMDIEVVRGLRDQYGQYTYLRSEKLYNIQVGTIGCDLSCMQCTNTTANDCVICSDPSAFNYQGICMSKCPTSAPFYVFENLVYQSFTYVQGQCLAQCPYGYYGDPTTLKCLSCNSDCLTCNSSVIASCLSCNPVMYLFNGICVDQCPIPHHVGNYTDYICHQISSTTYLKVKIQSLGFINRIPKDKVTFLKSDINNTNGGKIVSIEWDQLTPDIGLYNVLGTSSGQYSRYSQNVQLDNNALLKLSSAQVIKVQCTVTNSIGEIAYDIYEFYTNDAPVSGSLSVSFVGEAYNSVGSAIDSLVYVKLANWSASANNLGIPLKLKVFLVSYQTFGQITYSRQLTLTDQLSTNDIYLRLPVLSNRPTQATSNITFCVGAEDQSISQTSKCINLQNVKNKMTFLQNYTLIVSYLQELNLTQYNISTLLHATQIIYNGIGRPNRPNSQPKVCTLDQHCGNNGQCMSISGVQKCECFQGYFGTQCDFQGNQLYNLQQIVMKIIDIIYTLMTSKNQILSFDIEVIGNVVRGFTNSPDLVNDMYFVKLLTLLELASNANLYSQQGVDVNTTNILIDGYANGFMKIYQSFKQQKAMVDTTIIGEGYSVIDDATMSAYSNYVIQNRRLFEEEIEGINEQEAIASCNHLAQKNKDSLVGYDAKNLTVLGALSTNFRGRALDGPDDVMMSVYQQWGRRIDLSFNQFLDMYMLKLNPINNQYIYKTQAFELQLVWNTSAAIKNSKVFISQTDAFWTFPGDIWDNQQGVASSYHDVKNKLIKYILNPFTFEDSPGANLESNVTSVKFYSMGNNEIKVNLTGSTVIEYREPFVITQNYNPQLLKCMAWDEINFKFINDKSCIFQQIYSILPCIGCDAYSQVNTTVSACRCKHLSRFGVVTEISTPLLTVPGNSPGIYSDFYALAFWQNSFGYYAAIAGLCTFLTGQLACYIIDRRMQNNLIIRMKEKVRKFELQFGTSVRRLDGLFFRSSNSPDKIKGRNTAKKKVYAVQNENEEDEGLMEDHNIETEVISPKKFKHSPNDENGDLAEGPQQIKGKKKFLPKKKFNQADLVEEEPDMEASPSPVPVKGKKKMLGKKQKGVLPYKDSLTKRSFGNDAQYESPKKKQNEDYVDGEELKDDDLNERADFFNDGEEQVYILDEHLSEQQKDQLRRQKNVMNKIKKEQTEESLYYELMCIKLHDVMSMTRKEFKRKILAKLKKLTKDHKEMAEERLKGVLEQLNSTDEEITNGLHQLFIRDKHTREQNLYRLKNMIVDGSYLLSLLFVTSIVSPRHIRWTLVFGQICMNWFIVAVFFNNTRSPLAVPNFSKQASQLAIGELWISFISPWGSLILMYIVAGFFKASSGLLYNCATSKQIEQAIIDVRREMKMKFFLGYCLTVTIFAVIFWYIITFSANFGWKVSWTWWWAGIFSIGLQLMFVDPLCSTLHWGIYRFNPRAGRIIMSVRGYKQAHCEITENPFEEEDDDQPEDEIKDD